MFGRIFKFAVVTVELRPFQVNQGVSVTVVRERSLGNSADDRPLRGAKACFNW